MSMLSVLRTLRYEDCYKFEASLGYIVNTRAAGDV